MAPAQQLRRRHPLLLQLCWHLGQAVRLPRLLLLLLLGTGM
jgi:hypothetical protein